MHESARVMDRPPCGMLSASSELATITTIDSVPTRVLEEIAMLCTPAANASARQVCRLWRSAFGWPTTLLLYSQRPAHESARLVGGAAPPFPRAARAKLVLASSAAACSQPQLDTWLDALHQRTAITRLTLSSEASVSPSHSPTPLSLARLASLHHLRALVLGPTMSQAGLEAAAAGVGQLTFLTYLRFSAPCRQRAVAALTASLSSGLPQLATLKLCLGTDRAVHHGRVTEADIQSLVQAAAAGAPSLRVIVCRQVYDLLSAMRAIEAAFAPAALHAMRVLLRDGKYFKYGPRLCKPAGGNGMIASVRAKLVNPGRAPAAGAPGGAGFPLCVAGLEKAQAMLLSQGMGHPHPVVESLTLTVTGFFCPAVLDLSTLPATLGQLIMTLEWDAARWPLVCGAAPELTSLVLNMASREGCAQLLLSLAGHSRRYGLDAGAAPEAEELLPLAELSAACPNLCCLHVDLGKSSCGPSTWAPLALLQKLTRLGVHSNRVSSMQTLPATCLPRHLVQLDLCNVRVPAASATAATAAAVQPPSLGHLRKLCLESCYVADFRVFSGADGMRHIFVWNVTVGAGAEALLCFQELEILDDRSYEDCELLLTAAAFAAAARAAEAGGGGGGDGGSGGGGGGGCAAAEAALPMLPRLRCLAFTSFDGVSRRPLCSEGLLSEVPVQELILDAWTEAASEGTAEWLRPLGSLRSLVVLKVTGRHRAGFVPLLQSLLPSVVVE